jgi:hypothetical protein
MMNVVQWRRSKSHSPDKHTEIHHSCSVVSSAVGDPEASDQDPIGVAVVEVSLRVVQRVRIPERATRSHASGMTRGTSIHRDVRDHGEVVGGLGVDHPHVDGAHVRGVEHVVDAVAGVRSV